MEVKCESLINTASGFKSGISVPDSDSIIQDSKRKTEEEHDLGSKSEKTIKVSDEASTDPKKKKSAGKQENGEPSSKRLAQNRAAQRAFRERKETYVKGLESKVKELEEAQRKSEEEKERLLEYLHKLREENQCIKRKSSIAQSVNTLPGASLPMFEGQTSNSSNAQVSGSQGLSQTNFDLCSSANNGPVSGLDRYNFNMASGPEATTAGADINNLSSEFHHEFYALDDYMFPSVVAPTSAPDLSVNLGSSTLNYNSSNHYNLDNSMFPESLNYANSYNNNDTSYPHSMLPPSYHEVNTDSFPMTSEQGSTNTAAPSSPELDPFEIMNPFRPPPTAEELQRLVAHHRKMWNKKRDSGYTIDDLCEAMKTQATCAAVHEYLTSYLGKDPIF